MEILDIPIIEILVEFAKITNYNDDPAVVNVRHSMLRSMCLR